MKDSYAFRFKSDKQGHEWTENVYAESESEARQLSEKQAKSRYPNEKVISVTRIR